MELNRKTLQEIREAAGLKASADERQSQSWVRAYQSLEDAANVLDAMFARTQLVKEKTETKAQ